MGFVNCFKFIFVFLFSVESVLDEIFIEGFCVFKMRFFRDY